MVSSVLRMSTKRPRGERRGCRWTTFHSHGGSASGRACVREIAAPGQRLESSSLVHVRGNDVHHGRAGALLRGDLLIGIDELGPDIGVKRRTSVAWCSRPAQHGCGDQNTSCVTRSRILHCGSQTMERAVTAPERGLTKYASSGPSVRKREEAVFTARV